MHVYIMIHSISRWRLQMETFSALLALCAGNSPVIGEFPSQRPVMRRFYVLFALRLNKRFSKQSWCWWFETPSCSLWRHCNVFSFDRQQQNPQSVRKLYESGAAKVEEVLLLKTLITYQNSLLKCQYMKLLIEIAQSVMCAMCRIHNGCNLKY